MIFCTKSISPGLPGDGSTQNLCKESKRSHTRCHKDIRSSPAGHCHPPEKDYGVLRIGAEVPIDPDIGGGGRKDRKDRMIPIDIDRIERTALILLVAKTGNGRLLALIGLSGVGNKLQSFPCCWANTTNVPPFFTYSSRIAFIAPESLNP